MKSRGVGRIGHMYGPMLAGQFVFPLHTVHIALGRCPDAIVYLNLVLVLTRSIQILLIDVLQQLRRRRRLRFIGAANGSQQEQEAGAAQQFLDIQDVHSQFWCSVKQHKSRYSHDST